MSLWNQIPGLQRKEKAVSHGWSNEKRKMHELPGETLEDKDIARYESDNASLFADAENRLKKQIESQQVHDRFEAIRIAPLLSEAKRALYIMRGLEDESILVLSLATKYISQTPLSEQEGLYNILSKKVTQLIQDTNVLLFENKKNY